MQMGACQNCHGRLRHLHFIILVLVLLISSSLHCSRYMVEGRNDFKLLDHHVSSQIGGEVKAIVRSQIGSRPPRCDRRCRSCGHCEAVQVPAVPQIKGRVSSSSSSRHSTVSMRGEDGSNYKPMSWKCKCGDMIFNP